MRKTTLLLLVPALMLAACSSEKPADHSPDGYHRPLPTPSEAAVRQHIPDPQATDTLLPTVTGPFGARATISVPKAVPTGRFVVMPMNEGRGRAARNGDAAIVKYSAVVWKTGKHLPDSYAAGAHPRVFSVGRGSILAALDRAVHGQRAGSRVLVVAPAAAAYGSTGNARLGVSGKDTIVFVVDVMRVIAAHETITGSQADVSEDLPRVRMNRAQGTAAITVPDHGAPVELTVEPLVTGAGPVVKSGQTVVLQHSSTAWESARGKDQGELFMSSHAAGEPLIALIGRGNVLPGWDKALVGQRVGSRVLVVIPASLAYGEHPPKGITANTSVVSVLDVLAAA
ncbi:FKBP-type peptidyl-prolyl cis-trans isomerase [Streptomyces sp. NPDC057291]|uniref:FKBP-type peptidyl-prolyl cis-trans isomerase n=1 Tax=Streptomyces sp. NPDC057291 TaxID=3346087 RepID=UPI00362E6EF1